MNRTLVMIVEEPQSGSRWTYVLKTSPVVMGRDPESCDVAFARPSVSKVQAEIAFHDNKITYRDLDSRNGSIVNGEPILADVAIPISPTSEIVIGGRLRLTFSEDASVKESEGANPFDPPRIKSPLVLEPTTAHVGPVPVTSPAPRPSVPKPESIAPPPRPVVRIPQQPMPDPAEQTLVKNRLPPTDVLPPEPPPTPKESMASPPTPVPLKPGDIVAQYRVEGVIGRGGMGTVYKVSHLQISAKRFAMKVLSPDVVGHPEAEIRFMREAEAAARIEHPNVVGMVDFGRDRGITYLVMDLLQGEDLGARIARKALTVERVSDIMLAVCSGVHKAHQLGIIHRDLKPQNIFLSRIATGDTVPMVLDFGISKLCLPGDSKLTRPDTLVGTLNYMSPEQANDRPVDARCDVYALGAIIYECVTGRRCHEENSRYEILRSIMDGVYPLPSELCPDLPLGFEAVILKALARDPDQRFASVHDLGRALLPFASLKRRIFWKKHYLPPSGRQLDSSSIDAIPLSLSKYDAPVQPKTELLPDNDAKDLANRYLRKRDQSPTTAPAPSSSPGHSSSSRSPTRQKDAPPVLLAKAVMAGWRSRPILISGLLGVAFAGVVIGILLYRHGSQIEVVRTDQPSVQTQPSPSAKVAAPAPTQAVKEEFPPTPSRGAEVAPAPPTVVNPSAPPSTGASPNVRPARFRAGFESPRPTHAARTNAHRLDQPVKRNRNGTPILEP